LGTELRNRWDLLLVIAAGGAIGSLARWQLAQRLPHSADAFPWATFDANIAGCLLLGVLMVVVTDVWPSSRYLRPFLGVGVLGGFTTFSSYLLEARSLLASGHLGTAGTYLFGSLAAGLVAVWAGVRLTRLTIRTADRRSG
jgi:CrcB protein